MESKEFLNALRREAEKAGFLPCESGWLLEKGESDECRIAMSYTKSRWGQSYMLIIKVYIVGAFGWSEQQVASMIRGAGHVFRGMSPECKNVFDLESDLSDAERAAGVADVFVRFIKPFTGLARTRAGIKALEGEGEVYILPAVQEEIQRLAS